MTRLLYSPDPATHYAVDFDGEDAPVLGVGARHGHPDGHRVTMVNRQAGVYILEPDDESYIESRPIPPRWLEVDFGDGSGPPDLITHFDVGGREVVSRIPYHCTDVMDPADELAAIRALLDADEVGSMLPDQVGPRTVDRVRATLEEHAEYRMDIAREAAKKATALA